MAPTTPNNPHTNHGVRPLGPSPEVVRGMQAGQHVIAAVLTLAGTARAVAEGTHVALAISAGVAIGLGYTLGAVLVAKSGKARLARYWLLGLTGVWIFAAWISPEFVWFAFLLWLLAGHLFPQWWSVGYAIVVYAVVVATPVLHHGATGWANVFGPLIGGVFALGISRGYLRLLHDAAERELLVTHLEQAHREANNLQDELALTQRHAGQVAERTRLARDIHDTVAQNLSSVRLLAHAAANRSIDPDATQTFAQVETLAVDGLVDVRRIVAALAPAELESQALAAALTRMLDRLHEQTGLATELHADDTLAVLPAGTEIALMRTAQSALANVRLHASASQVVVNLIDDQDRVRLDIIDDGQGFDVPAWESAPRAVESGYGLRFMRSRLVELGGGLEIESAPGDGTGLSAHIPLSAAPATED